MPETRTGCNGERTSRRRKRKFNSGPSVASLTASFRALVNCVSSDNEEKYIVHKILQQLAGSRVSFASNGSYINTALVNINSSYMI